MRVFKTRAFNRFARRAGIGDAALIEAVRRAEKGLVQADLGGGLIKQRIGREGQGRSGGFRTLIAYRTGKLAIFLFGFAKNDRGNIGDDEVATLKELAHALLVADHEHFVGLVRSGGAEEIDYE